MHYKYTLHYLLRRLPVEDYELTMKELPVRCGVNQRTFQRWIYCKNNDYADMPLTAACAIASWFQIDVLAIYTNTPQGKTLTDAKQD